MLPRPAPGRRHPPRADEQDPQAHCRAPRPGPANRGDSHHVQRNRHDRHHGTASRQYKEQFEKTHGVGAGLHVLLRPGVPSLALRNFPLVNAQIDGDDIVYHDYVHLGIAVSTDRGLAVPVLRNVEQMSFARSRTKSSASPPRPARENFRCTNSAAARSRSPTAASSARSSRRRFSTRRSPAFSACTRSRNGPVAINDKVEIRPMMYVALSYDHRLVDGHESVSLPRPPQATARRSSADDAGDLTIPGGTSCVNSQFG